MRKRLLHTISPLLLLPSIATALPDLIVTRVEAPPILFAGREADVGFRVLNVGSSTAQGPFVQHVYISRTDTITLNDRLLWEGGAIESLSPGHHMDFDVTVLIPEDIPDSQRWIGVITDPYSMVDEPNLRNNAVATPEPSQLRRPAPDLDVRSVQAPRNGAAGETIPIMVAILNSGNEPGTFDYGVYLSVNDIVSPHDLLLFRAEASLEPGSQIHFSQWIRLPASLAPGEYHVGVIADPDDVLDEVHKHNNVAVAPETIAVAPPSLSLYPSWIPAAMVGAPLAWRFIGQGGTSPYEYDIAGGELPPGVSLDSSTGELLGAPAQTGEWSFVARVISGEASVAAAYNLIVTNPSIPLEVQTNRLRPALMGETYETRLTALGGQPPYNWRVIGDLPSGFSISETGDLTGLPTAAGLSSFRVSVNDALSAEALADLDLRVIDSGSLTISTELLPPAQIGQSLLTAFDAIGGRPPLVWSVAHGSLPAGLTLEATTGILTGTPEEAGRSSFGVRVTDADGLTDLNSFSIDVTAQALAIVTRDLMQAVLGEPYEQALVVLPASGTPPYTWWIRSGRLAEGLDLDASGHISGTPQLEGTYPMIIAVEDSRGATGLRAFALEVVDPSRAAELQRPIEVDGGCVTGADVRGSGAGTALGLLLVGVAILALRRRRRTAALFLAAIFVSSASAQTATDDYSLIVEPEIYIGIDDGTPVHFTNQSSGHVTLQIPFTFMFYGQPYTSIGVSTNGIILLGTISSAHVSNATIPNSAAPNGFIAPWWDNLEGGVDSRVSTKVEGSAPNRAFVVQYKNWYRNPMRSIFNFQVRFFEGTNIIKVNYGPAVLQSDDSNASVGIESPNGEEGIQALACTPQCRAGDFPSGMSMLYARLPDLATVDVSGPAIIDAGLATGLEAHIKNVGGRSAAQFRVRAYISERNRFDGTARMLPGYVDIPALGVGGTVKVPFSTTIPADVEPGRFYNLFVVPNPDGTLIEVSQQNNPSQAVPTYSRHPMPNFRAEAPFPHTSSVMPGVALRVTFTIRNTGNLGSSTPYRVVLSENRVISREDLTILEGSVALGAGEARTITQDIPIPAEVSTAAYYVGLLVDPDGTVPELNELTNSAASATQVAVTSGELVVTTSDLPPGLVDQPYHAPLSAGGGTGIYNWSIASGTMPEGLALRTNGRIEGAPRLAGDYRLRLLVRSGDFSQLVNLDLTVADPTTALEPATHQLPEGLFGWEYEARLRAAGGRPPYQWNIEEGSLPAGLQLAEDGWLGGVPLEDGDFDLVVAVADQEGSTALQNLDLMIGPSLNLVVVTMSLPQARVDEPYQQSLVASGGTPPYRWRADGLGRLPRGLSISESGEVHGVPTEIGIFDVSVRVEDARARSDTNTITLEVGYDQNLTIVDRHLPPAMIGQQYDYTLRVTGGRAPFIWRLAGRELPPGLVLESSGRIHGTAIGDQELLFPFAVEVVDDTGRRGLEALAIRLGDPPSVPEEVGCSTSTGRGGLLAILLVAALAVLRPGRRAGSKAYAMRGGLMLLIAIALAASGCGEKDLCLDVTCPAGAVCSPSDGECRCGGVGGEVCSEDAICDPSIGRCHSSRNECEGVRCSNLMSCDPVDGECRCGGSGGSICGEDEICETVTGRCITTDRCENIRCEGDAVCDPLTGLCVCGEEELICAPGTVCEEGECIEDPCRNVSCPSGTVCVPEGPECRCGGIEGDVCAENEVCDPTSGTCLEAPSCVGVVCSAGTTCDPNDGKCKCGGAGGEYCGPDQSCDLAGLMCVGGDPCLGITCVNGTSCDPEDGTCRCGGLGGPHCADGEICLDIDAGDAFCTPNCDPVRQDCGDGLACYYSPSLHRAFCYAAGNSSTGMFCAVSTQCEAGDHCDDKETSRRCLSYCDTASIFPQPGSCSYDRYCDPVFPYRPSLGVCRRH